MGISRYISILFLLLFSLNSFAGLRCDSLFKMPFEVKSSNWDHSTYSKTSEQVAKFGHTPSRLEFNKLEVKLGFINGLIKRSGLEGEFRFEQIPKKFMFDSRVSEYKAQKLIDTLLQAQQHKMFFLKRWFMFHKSSVYKQKIDTYIKEQMMLKEFLNLLKENHLYKENSKFEKVKQFLHEHQSYQKVFNSILINYFSIQWFGFPMYLPEFKFLNQKKLTDEQLGNFKSINHDQRMLWVESKYMGRVNIDRVLNFPRDAFPAFMTVTLLYYAFNPIMSIPDYIVQSSSSEFYKAWIEIYHEQNGHYPNVFFNISDRNEWADLYHKIVDQYSTH